MSDESVSGRVNALVAEYLDADSDDTLPDATLAALGADEGDVDGLLMELENEFDIDLSKFGDDGTGPITMATVGELIEAIKKEVAKQH